MMNARIVGLYRLSPDQNIAIIAVEVLIERYAWYDPETGETEPIGVEVEV